MKNEYNFQHVAWSRWNASGYRTHTSKAHLCDDSHSVETLCGRTIPTEGNGIEFEDDGQADCKACRRKADAACTCDECGHAIENTALCDDCDRYAGA